MFIISTDSCVDRKKNELSEQSVFCMPTPYELDNKPKLDSFNSDNEYESFFELLRAGKTAEITPITSESMQEYFRKIMREGYGDIVHICPSAALFNNWQVAAEAAVIIMSEAEFEGRIIYPVDSKSLSGGVSLLVDVALKLRTDGATSGEAFAELNRIVPNIQGFIFVEDVKQLKKTNRMGFLLGSPRLLLTLKADGSLAVVSKPRNAAAALTSLIDAINEFGAKVSTERSSYPFNAYLSHSDSALCADFSELVAENAKYKVFRTASFGASNGAIFGEGAVGVFFAGKAR